MSIFVFSPGREYTFHFTNYRDEVEIRHVIAVGTAYGSNEYYPTPTWFLHTWDIERGEYRSFKLARIDSTTLRLEP